VGGRALLGILTGPKFTYAGKKATVGNSARGKKFNPGEKTGGKAYENTEDLENLHTSQRAVREKKVSRLEPRRSRPRLKNGGREGLYFVTHG